MFVANPRKRCNLFNLTNIRKVLSPWKNEEHRTSELPPYEAFYSEISCSNPNKFLASEKWIDHRLSRYHIETIKVTTY